MLLLLERYDTYRIFYSGALARAPWVRKSTHPRKFGNHVRVHRPSVRTTAKAMFNVTLSS